MLKLFIIIGVIKNGKLHGKKIGTATMSEAKIQATVSSKFELEGSLGSLQILDLTPEGQVHQSILSVGNDPRSDNYHSLYTLSSEEKTALSFKIIKTEVKDALDVAVRMASVWYTHSPHFILELHSCLSEFKQYLTNLAKTIKTAATDMALGLVNIRTEALVQSINFNKNTTGSTYGSSLSIAENFTPTKKRSPINFFSKDTEISSPCSPIDDNELIINLNLNIELDSPVIVLPRNNVSSEVFVIHLGKITINNDYSDEVKANSTHYRNELYNIDVKDMNIFSLDIKSRKKLEPKSFKPDILYNCKTDAKPILHDTILQLKIEKEYNKPLNNFDQDITFDEDMLKTKKYIQISGSIVTALKVSLTMSQYKQIWDTLQWLSSINFRNSEVASRIHSRPNFVADSIKEEDSGLSTLNMDPHVRAKMFQIFSANRKRSSLPSLVETKICFDVSLFTVELKGIGQSLVNISFVDFAFKYDKCHEYETNIQISLRSLFMEDLQQPLNSKYRVIVASSSGSESSAGHTSISRSCPVVSYPPYLRRVSASSLPDHLEANEIFGLEDHYQFHDTVAPNNEDYPFTPPPSPERARSRAERNLVIISTLLVDPSAPNFQEYYNSVQNATSIDFNCLDLIISNKSWVIVLDFFSYSPEPVFSNTGSNEDLTNQFKKEKVVTNINIKSLTIVLAEQDREIAKANVSDAEIEINNTENLKEVDAKLGSLSLHDLTLNGQLYKDRFLTSGSQAVIVKYIR